MNYITFGKNLYGAMVFAFILATMFAISIPSSKVMASYPVTTNVSIPGYYSGVSGYRVSDSSNSNSGQYNDNNGYQTNNSHYGNQGNQNIAVDSKPVISTEPAIEIGKTSALIQGATHIDSGTANVWFEWGTKVDKLDNSTRSTYVDSASTGYSVMLTNLTPGTKYYFRIVGYNSTGKCYGIVRSFTTASTTIIAKAKASGTSTTTTYSSNTTYSNNSNHSSFASSEIKGNLSASAANASGGRAGFLPKSFLAWIIVIFLVFAIAMTVRIIQRESEERKKIEEEKKKALTA